MAKIVGVPPFVARAHEMTLFGLSGLGALVPGSLGQEITPGAIGEAAAKVACIATGGVWNDTLKQCIAKIGPIIGPTQEQLCVQAGGTWDLVARECKVAPVPPPEKKKEGPGPIGWLALGTAAFALGWWMSSRRTSKRRR